jgi:hypothetical protein
MLMHDVIVMYFLELPTHLRARRKETIEQSIEGYGEV